ncbi:hypothetical protein [Streptomyces sp. GC420]|uniref:hypothetical protein n=1 Tax=Streptomyces sp. GC420 TaxID=2697568 RepID=UPI001414CCA6|nr:hypothetical protein [Streptomyces sp. GC420]NBM14695.1 hypothetical protein [Streptomyces sp. GC420]
MCILRRGGAEVDRRPVDFGVTVYTVGVQRNPQPPHEIKPALVGGGAAEGWEHFPYRGTEGTDLVFDADAPARHV